MIIVDNKIRKIETDKLKDLGYEIFYINNNPNLYFEISGHQDIHCCKIKNTLISAPNTIIPNSIKGNSILTSKYPFDIPYNICIFGNYAIHNFKYTDSKIMELLDYYNYKKININQGYAKCSIAVIDDNSVIVTDKKIAKILSSNGIEVLLISDFVNSNIKLYQDKELNYSSMHGFIGGAISRIDDYIFISGDLKKFDIDNKIRDFITKRNLTLIDFEGLDIIDYGGILKI